jgi:hypothetical protein
MIDSLFDPESLFFKKNPTGDAGTDWIPVKSNQPPIGDSCRSP